MQFNGYRYVLVASLLVILPSVGLCQFYLTEVHSRWNDRFDEWEILTEDGSSQSVYYLSLSWPLQRNWEEWRLEGEDLQAIIRTKWRGDLSTWEVRSNDEIIVIKQVYRNDPGQWEIRSGDTREIISTQWPGNPSQWHMPRRRGEWVMAMDREFDPRDWIIEDYLENTLSPLVRLSAVFITLWQTIPK